MARARSKDKNRSKDNRRNKPRSSSDNRPGERKYKRILAPQSSERENADRFSPAPPAKSVEKLLHGIGTPEPAPIVPDAFQIEALEAIETQDVLVTAPTGSGKTWIAREEIRRLLEQGKRAWYTTPLKALTNSKYQEFGAEFGFERVGILTGDRKINHDAPLIVGTTEIYRNQLFDALRQGEQVQTDFVILDEAHYLADEERGHVWEEAIILSPPRIRLLLLSATVGNAEEFANWIEEVRGTRVRVINRAGTRPVELRAAFLAPNLQLFPLFGDDGKMNREIEQFAHEENRFERRRRY
ncbi:MAG: DEAD/DEAH box helicase [Acidobacteria bacterium]|jgi:superfamily II RNA helicase|nr:DEAD/DEAH box helicase [Acidobacteriota bacterium]